MRKIGVNTFGLNACLKNDYEGTFRTLREIGYDSVEPIVVFSDALGQPAEAMEAGMAQAGYAAFWSEKTAVNRILKLRDAGFTVDGAHLGLVGMTPGGLKSVLPYLGGFAERAGLQYYVHSPQKKTIEAALSDMEAFREGIRLLRDRGVELLFHCHYEEFHDNGGDTVFDYLLREIPELRVQLDVGWVQYAGVDAVELMKRYSDRIAILHFKDFANSGKDKDFCAIGEGKLSLREIMREAKNIDLAYTEYIIDQDASSGDMLEDLRIGYNHIRSLED